MIRTCVLAAAGLAILASGGLADLGLSAGAQKVQQVVNSTELSKEQKVAKLREMVGVEETRAAALYDLNHLDENEATAAAIDVFRAKESSRELKLRMGHFVLQVARPQRKGLPEAFVKEFATYLVGAVVEGGEKELCRKLTEGTVTAVGEYACLASDFGGYQGVDFSPFKDARVVPVLIRGLDAPDDVYSRNQGDLIRGKPGESTGRNTARQQIPVALAKLGDPRAVEPLKNALLKGTDIYTRMNSAYALARLTTPEDRAAVGSAVLAKPELLWCCLPYGKGLIEAGDDRGLEFLSVSHAGGYGALEYPHEIEYMLKQRLAILKGFKSPKVEGFVREVLAFKPWRAMVLFEPGSVKIDPAMYVKKPKDEAEALEQAAPGILEVYGGLLECVEANHLKGLSADLEEIAGQTRSEKIREMTAACLKTLAS
jgi:PBS lyase HEAT-like repeat